MKKGYWVVAYRAISEESATKAYAELAVPAIESFAGRFLARTSIKSTRTKQACSNELSLSNFDSYEIALAAYESEVYKKALKALGSGAERDFRIVEGA